MNQVPSTLSIENIELNEKFLQAINLMENTWKNIFITGRAGTGKSTLLEYFKQKTKKKIAILAPTGVAALNVGGQTIHSFFGFGPEVTLSSIENSKRLNKKIYKIIETIVIDEVSMVRADLLDCVDKFLRINRKNKDQPFGGIQMIFIGDLYQLPPVVVGKEREMFKTHYASPYFFDSKVLSQTQLEFIELEKIYRQKDQNFIELLNAIRNRTITESQIDKINKRVDQTFESPPNDFYITLTTTNDISHKINEKELSKLSGKYFSYKGQIEGQFDKNYIPTEIDLKLKIGAQVMLLNNDPSRRWINGTIGKITEVKKEGKEEIIIVELPKGEKVKVSRFSWTIYKLYYNTITKALDSEIIGTFTQYPLKLAWSVTIHKGQGKTFEKVIVDIGKGTFSHGQMYVALSRCTSLNGIVLKTPIQKNHIFMDWRIVNFLTKYQYKLAEKNSSLENKLQKIKNAIKNKSKLYITYLKTTDTKTKRTILPKKVGDVEYLGKIFKGIKAYCYLRQTDRVFRIDRILSIEEVE